MLRLPLHASTLGPVAAGAILLFAPVFVLELVTTEEWALELLRYVGLVAILLGLLWDSVKRPDADYLHPARRRAGAAWILLAVYLFSSAGFFLLIGFSLLTAATVEIAMARAIAYSEALRRQIDPPQRRPPAA